MLLNELLDCFRIREILIANNHKSIDCYIKSKYQPMIKIKPIIKTCSLF